MRNSVMAPASPITKKREYVRLSNLRCMNHRTTSVNLTNEKKNRSGTRIYLKPST
jgi:hypothetical protein